jgi:hypothetical protein
MIRLAYHADPRTKEEYVQRVRAHAAAHEVVRCQGAFWTNGHGSAMGCTLHSSEWEMYETLTGIPVELACIAEGLCDVLAPDCARTWPTRFLEAIVPGAMLALVGASFLSWLLSEELVARDHPTIAAAVKEITPLPTRCGPDFSGPWATALGLSDRTDAYPHRLPGRFSCALGAVYGVAQAVAHRPGWMFGASVAVKCAAEAAGWMAAGGAVEVRDPDRKTDAAARMADQFILLLRGAPVPGPPYIDK